MFNLRIIGDVGFEVWKDIHGYEGLYQASTYGRVRSLPRATTSGRVLKPKVEKIGYLRLSLSKDNSIETKLVHRLISLTFIPNPNNFPQVNHLDEDKTNNRVENLEWCTAQYNSNYGTHVDRCAEHNRNHPSKSIPVAQYDLNGNLIARYPSAIEAYRITGIHFSNILRVCKGEFQQSRGYKWHYE